MLRGRLLGRCDADVAQRADRHQHRDALQTLLREIRERALDRIVRLVRGVEHERIPGGIHGVPGSDDGRHLLLSRHRGERTRERHRCGSDQRDHSIAGNQTLRGPGRRLGAGLIVVDDQLERSAIDPALPVDQVHLQLGCLLVVLAQPGKGSAERKHGTDAIRIRGASRMRRSEEPQAKQQRQHEANSHVPSDRPCRDAGANEPGREQRGRGHDIDAARLSLSSALRTRRARVRFSARPRRIRARANRRVAGDYRSLRRADGEPQAGRGAISSCASSSTRANSWCLCRMPSRSNARSR